MIDTYEIIHSFLFIRHLNAALEVFWFLARSVDFVASLLMRSAAQCFLSANINQLFDLTVYSHFNLLPIYETGAHLIDGKHQTICIQSLKKAACLLSVEKVSPRCFSTVMVFPNAVNAPCLRYFAVLHQRQRATCFVKPPAVPTESSGMEKVNKSVVELSFSQRAQQQLWVEF